MSDPGDFVNCSRRIRAKTLFEKQFFTFLFMLSHTNLCLSGNGICQFIHIRSKITNQYIGISIQNNNIYKILHFYVTIFL